MTPCLCSLPRRSKSSEASIGTPSEMWDETQDGEIVAAKLLALMGIQGAAQGGFLLAHGRSAGLRQQALEAPLAEGPAAWSADLVDETVGRQVEIVVVAERQRHIGEGRIGGIAAVAERLAIALDLDHVLAVGPP